MTDPRRSGLLTAVLTGMLLAGPQIGAARADTWVTYAHPNDQRDLALFRDALWIATTGGALRYDLGTGQFQQFPRRLAGGPTSQDLTAVSADTAAGLIFFGSSDEGVTQYDAGGDHWERFEFVPSNAINGLDVLDGELYVATAAGFAIRRTASRTDICNDIDRGCCGPSPSQCDFPSFDVRAFTQLGTHIWAATGGGPAEFDGDRWAARTSADVTDSRSIQAFGGTVFTSTPAAAGVFRWNPAAERWDNAGAGLPANSGNGNLARLVVSGGRLLLASAAGLYEWNGSSWDGTGLSNVDVRSAVVVNRIDFDMFAATRDGLYVRRLVGPTYEWHSLRADGPPLNAEGRAVAAGRDGVIWFGTIGGAMSLTPDGVWQAYPNGQGGIDNSEIYSIFADSQSRLWLGKCCCRNPPSCPVQFIAGGTASARLKAWDGWGLSEDPSGRLWIGSNTDGVHVLSAAGDSIINLTPINTSGNASGSLRSTSVRAVACEGNRVWLGHEDSGLQILNTNGDPTNPAGFSWKTFTGQGGSPLPDAAISDIALDRTGAWVLTSAYLVHFESDQKVQQIALNVDDEPRRGNAVDIDRKGNKWVATSDGVLRVDSGGQVDLLKTNNSDLVSNEILDVAVDPASGDVLFATRIGVSRLTPGGGGGGGTGSRLQVSQNPFRPGIDAPVKVLGATADKVRVVDLFGRSVAVFDPSLGWDGRTSTGRPAASGLYLIVDEGASAKLVLVR